jgi:hypothetical protein
MAEYSEKQARAEYETFDRDFLYEVAKERGIKGLSKSTKPELVDALVAHDKGQLQGETPTNPVNEIPPAPGATGATAPNGASGAAATVDPAGATGATGSLAQPNPDDPEVNKPPKDPLFPDSTLAEQTRRIRANPTSRLQAKLEDKDLPDHLRTLITAELREREQYEKDEAQRQQTSTKIARYRITVGGRYVTRGGYMTELPVNSFITEKTHDLAHVYQQGIRFTPAEAVVVSRDQLGNQVTRVV